MKIALSRAIFVIIKPMSNLVSVYPFPIVSMNVPTSWIDETAKQYEENSQAEEGAGNRSWTIARIIGKRAFQSYYKLPFDDHIEIADYKFRIYTVPISEWYVNIGKSLEFTFYKSSNDTFHIGLAWFLPRIDIIGFLPNQDLTERKYKINACNLNPITQHKLLSSLDKNNFII